MPRKEEKKNVLILSQINYRSVNEKPFFVQFFRVGEALILGTMMVGQATAFAPNFNKAMLAAARIFDLLDRKPLIDSAGESGLRLVISYRTLCGFYGLHLYCNYYRIPSAAIYPSKRPISSTRREVK